MSKIINQKSKLQIIFHIAQMLSIVLAFIWFGWQGGSIIFLVNWAINTEKYND